MENPFALRQNYKEKGYDVLQGLVILIMNRLQGIQILKDTIEYYNCKSEHWMQTEYTDNELDHWKLLNGIYIDIFQKNDGLDCDNDVKNTLSSHLGVFNLSNSK